MAHHAALRGQDADQLSSARPANCRHREDGRGRERRHRPHCYHFANGLARRFGGTRYSARVNGQSQAHGPSGCKEWIRRSAARTTVLDEFQPDLTGLQRPAQRSRPDECPHEPRLLDRPHLRRQRAPLDLYLLSEQSKLKRAGRPQGRPLLFVAPASRRLSRGRLAPVPAEPDQDPSTRTRTDRRRPSHGSRSEFTSVVHSASASAKCSSGAVQPTRNSPLRFWTKTLSPTHHRFSSRW